MTDTTRTRSSTSESRLPSWAHVDWRTPVIVPFPIPKTDVGLVLALRAKHPSAVRALCERYSGELVKVATRLLGPDPSVNAIVQMTIRHALNRLDQLTDPHFLRYWLLSQLIVRVSRRLKEKRFWRWFCLERTESSLKRESFSEQLVSTYRQLDHLDVGSRIAFCLVVIHSMAPTEVSLLLGTSALDVKTKLAQAHARFRRRVCSRVPQLTQQHASHASLGIEVAHEQDRMLARNWLFKLDLQEQSKGTKRLTSIVVLASILSLLAIALVTLTPYLKPVTFHVVGENATPRDEARLGAWFVATAQRTPTVAFSDGSTLTMAPDSRMRVLDTNYRGITNVLESGMAHWSVVEHAPIAHRVAAGPFTVHVENGQVSIHWDFETEMLMIIVHQGGAVLSGCQFGNGNSISSGRSLQVRCRPR